VPFNPAGDYLRYQRIREKDVVEAFVDAAAAERPRPGAWVEAR
jgi:hypothetical protein